MLIVKVGLGRDTASQLPHHCFRLPCTELFEVKKAAYAVMKQRSHYRIPATVFPRLNTARPAGLSTWSTSLLLRPCPCSVRQGHHQHLRRLQRLRRCLHHCREEALPAIPRLRSLLRGGFPLQLHCHQHVHPPSGRFKFVAPFSGRYVL